MNSLSSGWTGTCPILQIFSSTQSNYISELSPLSSLFSSHHQTTMYKYNMTHTLMEELFTFRRITAAPPSGSSETLTPKFEYEFSDKNNDNLIGGKMYKEFNSNLKPYIEKEDDYIKKNRNSLIDNNSVKNMIDNAYSKFEKFDKTVSTASNIINNNILDLKDYFLTIQTFLMIFTWGYLFFFLVIIVMYIVYLVKQNNKIYCLLIVLVNILFVIILVEIIFASLFAQVRLINQGVPRAMNFIFAGNYISSGNSGSYPAKFGEKDSNMTNMFTTCLNGDGGLTNLYINTNDLNNFTSLKNDASSLYTRLNQVITSSNIILNNYNSINNNIFLKTIDRLELMKNNLLYTTEGFEDDDISNILFTIRKNLDSANCGMNNEYYVIKESDCPSGSIILTKIYSTMGDKHCYIIQNLESGASATYAGSSCENTYINNAITFLKQIDSLLDSRLEKVKKLQSYYSSSFQNLWEEVQIISEKLNISYSILNDSLSKAASISNCSSTRFDLIDFCNYIGDKAEYDAKIIVIFSSFLGVFGFVMLYSFLVILNSFREKNKDDDYEDFYQDRSKNKSREKLNSNKHNNSYDKDEEEEEEDDNYKKTKNKKIEMSYIKKNNEDSDDSS